MWEIKQRGSKKAFGKIIQLADKINVVQERKEHETVTLWRASNDKSRCLDQLFSSEKFIRSFGMFFCSETLPLLHLSDKLDLPSRSSSNVTPMWRWVTLSQSRSAVKGSFLWIRSTLCRPLLHWVVISQTPHENFEKTARHCLPFSLSESAVWVSQFTP